MLRIVLTHFHDGHAGPATEVSAWPGAEVVAHAAEAAVVRGDVPGPVPADLLPAEREPFASTGALLPPAPPCPVDREVREGDVLAFGGARRGRGAGRARRAGSRCGAADR